MDRRSRREAEQGKARRKLVLASLKYWVERNQLRKSFVYNSVEPARGTVGPALFGWYFQFGSESAELQIYRYTCCVF